MTKILITGDRNWTNKAFIKKVLIDTIVEHEGQMATGADITLINGGAKGADNMGASIASDLGITVITVRADWNILGKAAGPIRNKHMLDKEPDIVLAFHNDISTSKGTADCVREAKKRGYKVILYSEHSLPLEM